MFPSAIFPGSEFIPAKLIFRIFVTALNQIAMSFAPSHRFQIHAFGCIAENIGDLSSILANQQPFLAWFFIINNPNPNTRKVGFQIAPFVRP